MRKEWPSVDGSFGGETWSWTRSGVRLCHFWRPDPGGVGVIMIRLQCEAN